MNNKKEKNRFTFESSGVLNYHTTWVVLECDDEIIRYYAWLYKRLFEQIVFKPKWGAHISVVRGTEEGVSPGLWVPHVKGPVINFRYTYDVKWDDKYVWVDVESPELEKLRESLGFYKYPPFGFHLTVGFKQRP